MLKHGSGFQQGETRLLESSYISGRLKNTLIFAEVNLGAVSLSRFLNLCGINWGHWSGGRDVPLEEYFDLSSA